MNVVIDNVDMLIDVVVVFVLLFILLPLLARSLSAQARVLSAQDGECERAYLGLVGSLRKGRMHPPLLAGPSLCSGDKG